MTPRTYPYVLFFLGHWNTGSWRSLLFRFVTLWAYWTRACILHKTMSACPFGVICLVHDQNWHQVIISVITRLASIGSHWISKGALFAGPYILLRVEICFFCWLFSLAVDAVFGVILFITNFALPNLRHVCEAACTVSFVINCIAFAYPIPLLRLDLLSYALISFSTGSTDVRCKRGERVAVLTFPSLTWFWRRSLRCRGVNKAA